MQQHDRLAGTAGVPIPKTSAWELGHSFLGWNLFRNRHRYHRGVHASLIHRRSSTSHLFIASSRSRENRNSWWRRRVHSIEIIALYGAADTGHRRKAESVGVKG